MGPDPEGLALSSLASSHSRQAGAGAAAKIAGRVQELDWEQAIRDELRAAERHAAFVKQQIALAPARRAKLPAHAEWVAWHYARGKTQKAVGAELGVSNATACALIRRYIDAWLPEALAERPENWGDHYVYVRGDTRDLLRAHFGERPEPKPEGPAWDRMRQRQL